MLCYIHSLSVSPSEYSSDRPVRTRIIQRKPCMYYYVVYAITRIRSVSLSVRESSTEIVTHHVTTSALIHGSIHASIDAITQHLCCRHQPLPLRARTHTHARAVGGTACGVNACSNREYEAPYCRADPSICQRGINNTVTQKHQNSPGSHPPAVPSPQPLPSNGLSQGAIKIKCIFSA